MKSQNLRHLVGIHVALLSVTVLAEPTRQWNHGNPTGDEQYTLEVINRVRANPVTATEFYITQASSNSTLKATIDPLFWRDPQNNPLSGAAAFREITRFQLTGYANDETRTLPPKGPLAFYPTFMTAAVARATENLTKVGSSFFNSVSVNNQSFYGVGPLPYPAAITGSNATGGTARTKAGGPQANPAEFFYFGWSSISANLPPGYSMREVYAISQGPGVYLDDVFTQTIIGTFGNITSNTRGKTRMIGINISDVRTSAPGLGNRVLTTYATDNEAFATSDLPFGANTVFVTGVVYEDTDKNGDYTPGEGIAGVRVSPATGDWYAVTSASGGYAIPVAKNLGAVTVAFTSDRVNTSNVVSVGNDSVKLDVVYVDTSRPPQVLVAASEGNNRFINLSTRGIAGANADGMFGGFVITGTGVKRVLIRAVARGLVSFGLQSLLRKPLLTLFDSNGNPIKRARTQDTYETFGQVSDPTAPYGYVSQVKQEFAAIAASVGAFPLPGDPAPPPFPGNGSTFGMNGIYEPAGDAVMVADLPAGLYSVSITPDVDTLIRNTIGTIGGPSIPNGNDPDPSGRTWWSNGLVLLEIYDAGDSGGVSRFVNLSTRGQIETGARQMIVGFVLAGTGHRRVLVRGVGPALRGFGLTSALSDSAVTLFNSQSVAMLDNDDWSRAPWADQTPEISAAVGAFSIPQTSTDGIILTRVIPGLYSVAVRSGTGAPGIGLAEIYETP